jgi:hypothetical protein
MLRSKETAPTTAPGRSLVSHTSKVALAALELDSLHSSHQGIAHIHIMHDTCTIATNTLHPTHRQLKQAAAIDSMQRQSITASTQLLSTRSGTKYRYLETNPSKSYLFTCTSPGSASDSAIMSCAGHLLQSLHFLLLHLSGIALSLYSLL